MDVTGLVPSLSVFSSLRRGDLIYSDVVAHFGKGGREKVYLITLLAEGAAAARGGRIAGRHVSF